MGKRLRFSRKLTTIFSNLETPAELAQPLELVAADQWDALGALQVHVVDALGDFQGDRVAAVLARA